jgi:metal-responsive CopG/Arc/MetJ family transcriptional regulator
MKRITITMDETTAKALQAEAERDGKRGVSSLVRAALSERYKKPSRHKKGGRK